METNQTVTSQQFSLNWRDALRGLLLATISSVATIIYASIEQGSFDFDWKLIIKVASGSALAYLIKNFFTPASIKTTITNEEAKIIIAEKTAK